MVIDDPIVVTNRGGITENTHRVHVAVVDCDGRLLFQLGDPRRVTLARSAAKPAQAFAVLGTDVADRFEFDEADIALMCASHSSESNHLERTYAMLRKVGLAESDLRCGGHPAISDAVNRDWIKNDFTPTPACSNCSGKHVGMLAGALAIGASINNYHLPDHPIQKRVRRFTAELCDLPEDEVAWAIDGCNLPTPAFPLDRLARLYAKLAAAADGSLQSPPDTARTLRTIYRAMVDHPECVAGSGRYCTLLMQAFRGTLVGKLGADACYAIGVRDSDDTRRLGSNGALGISVKIEDGNIEILYAVVSEILQQLGIGTTEERAQLGAFHHPKRCNTMGVDTGNISFPFTLTVA